MCQKVTNPDIDLPEDGDDQSGRREINLSALPRRIQSLSSSVCLDRKFVSDSAAEEESKLANRLCLYSGLRFAFLGARLPATLHPSADSELCSD